MVSDDPCVIIHGIFAFRSCIQVIVNPVFKELTYLDVLINYVWEREKLSDSRAFSLKSNEKPYYKPAAKEKPQENYSAAG